MRKRERVFEEPVVYSGKDGASYIRDGVLIH